ncbi:hornerin [Biomphalaria glabrata]|nr:hornerin [Biomphalaria glabrata]
MVAALSRTSPLHRKQKPRDNPTRLSRDVLLGLSVFFVDESSAMTPYTHLLLLFLIYLLALPASVLSSPIGCDWLKIPDPNPGQPLFNDSEYKTTLAPDVPVGSPVLTVYANDTDVNDTMYYSLEDCDYTDWITVDRESGLIKVIRSLMDIYAIEIECTVLVQDRENLTDSTVKTDRSGLFIKLYDIREIVDDEDQFDSREVEWTTGEEMTTSPTVTTSSNIKIQTSKPTEGSSTSAKSTLATTTKPIVATTSKTTLVNTTTKPSLANTTTKPILVNITTKPTLANTTSKPTSATTIKPIGANTTKPTVATTTNPTVATTTKPTVVTTTKSTLATTTKPTVVTTTKSTLATTTKSTVATTTKSTMATTTKPTVVTTTKSTLATTTKPTVATTTKSTMATTTKPAVANTTKSTLATTTKPTVVTNITKPTVATNKTTTATVSNNKTQTSKPTNTSASTTVAYNKTQPFKSSTISTTVAYNKITTAKLKPGKTTATVKPKVTAKQTVKNTTGKVIQPSGAAKKNKTRLVKKVKKPGKEGGAPVEYDYEYEYDYADEGENVSGEIEASVEKGGKTRGVQKKKKTKTRGQGGYTESYERSYSYNDTSVEETDSEEEGSYDVEGKRRHNGRKKGVKKRKHGDSEDYDDYDYDYDYSSGNRSRSFGGGHKKKGQRWRRRHGENNTSSEEIGSWDASYSHNGTRNDTKGSFDSGSKESSYKHRQGIKYKGRRRHHKHGENSTSSEELTYYSYSYNGSRNNSSEVYSKGSSEKEFKRKGGYKYKGGKRKHRLGENSTSSEEAESESATYSYSYNGTRNETSGRYESYSKEKSLKHRGGHRYKGRKKSHRNGENSTSSEEAESGSAIYSYSYNGTRNETSGSYESNSKEKSYKHRGGHRYKGRKRAHRFGENSTSEELVSSSGYYSFDYNRTSNDTSNSYRQGSEERSHKIRGGPKYKKGKVRHGHGENSTSSERADSNVVSYEYSFTETDDRGEETSPKDKGELTKSKTVKGVNKSGKKRKGHASGESELSEHNSRNKSSLGNEKQSRGGSKHKGGRGRHTYGENSTSSEYVDYETYYYDSSSNGTSNSTGSYSGEERSSKIKDGRKQVKHVKRGKGIKSQNSSSQEDYDVEYYEYSVSKNNSADHTEKSYKNGSGIKGGKHRRVHGDNSTSGEYLGSGSGIDNGTGNLTSGSHMGSGKERSYKDKSDTNRGQYKAREKKRGKERKETEAGSESVNAGSRNESLSGNQRKKNEIGRKQRGNGTEENDSENFSYEYSFTESGNSTGGSFAGSGEEKSYKGETGKRKTPTKISGKRKWRKGEGFAGSKFSETTESEDRWEVGSRNESLSDSQTYSKNRNGFKRKRGKGVRGQGANSTSIEDEGSAASYFSSNWTGSDINDSDRGGISNSSHKHRGEKRYRSGNRNGLGRNSSGIEESGSESYNGTKGSWELSKTGQSDRQQDRNKNKIKINGKRRKSQSSFDQEEGFSAEDFGSWNRSESSRKHISKSKSNFSIQGRKKKYRKGENSTLSEKTGSGSGYYSYNGTRNSTSSENASAEEGSFSINGVRRKTNRGYKGRKRGYRKGAESGDNSTSLLWESREDNSDYSLNEGSTSVNGSHGEVDASRNIGNKLRRKSKYRVSDKHRNAKSNKGEKEGHISNSKGNVLSNEESYGGSINNSTNSESESRSGHGGKRGKKYRSGKRKISGKYRTGKSNRGEKEGNYSNSYFDYEEFEYNSTASNETEDIELRNRSSTGQGQKYRIGKHRTGGKHRKGNVTEGAAEGGNEEGAQYDYYYYYDYYDDTNETESSYDLGEEYEASEGTPEQLSGNVAATDVQAESGAGSSGSGGSDTVSSDGESSHWREEWTEAPTYGEYEYWQKEYEYEVTDQPTS